MNQSFEWYKHEQSAFTHFLLPALAGEADYEEKNFVTVDNVYKYLLDKLKLWASQKKKSQTPTLTQEVVGDIILVDHR